MGNMIALGAGSDGNMDENGGNQCGCAWTLGTGWVPSMKLT